tara:strand:- start:1220 stop:1354 length:135 start_codon:yes stop_codon:yes gene_type:complete
MHRNAASGDVNAGRSDRTKSSDFHQQAVHHPNSFKARTYVSPLT